MRISYTFAFLAVFFFALSDIGSRISVSLLDVSPVYFGTMQMLLGSVLLFIFSWGAQTRLSALKVWHNWAVGFFELSIVIVLVFLFQLISAAEASFMQRISTPMVALISFYIYKRKIDKADYIPLTIILASVLTLTLTLPKEVQLSAFLIVCYIALANSLLMLITEKNPLNHRHLAKKDRLRLTSIVMAISSGLVILTTLSIEHFALILPETMANSLTQGLQIAQIDLSAETLFAGSLLGAFVYGPALYCYFIAASRITANEILMCFSIAPFIVFGFEFGLSHLEVIEKSSLTLYDALIGGVGSLAALHMAFHKHKNGKAPENDA